MFTEVLFADDQIPWEDEAENKKVQQEIAKELRSKMRNVNAAYKRNRRWFEKLLNSLTEQGVKVTPARTYSKAEQMMKQRKDFDVVIIDLTWTGDRRLTSRKEKEEAGLNLLDLISKQNKQGDRYTPVIAFSQQYKTSPNFVATILECGALPIQKEYSEVGHRTLAAAVKLLAKLRPAPTRTSRVVATPSPRKIFIGHGGSGLWKDLKRFLEDKLKLECDEFNSVAVAGLMTTERLDTMMANAAFAFLIMTAEDEMADKSFRARSNVIHELGLFQGKLGRHRAIVLVEEECSEFSNIAGLSHINFPRGNIKGCFKQIKGVLQREKVLPPTPRKRQVSR
jgi:predicted nucleotide-binding protein